METPKPGIYQDVPFREYIAWQCVNNSRLSEAKRSMRHFQVNAGLKPSDALKFGILAHTAKLEPAAIRERYVVMPRFEDQVRTKDGRVPGNPRATNEYKELVRQFEADNQHREIVSREWYDQCLGIIESLAAHERARSYFSSGQRETSIVWQDLLTGLLCKARIDHLSLDSNRITDLKTTVDASDFEWSVRRYCYHRQAAFYLDGCRTLGLDIREFCIVAVEKEQPFGVRAAPVGEDELQAGRDEYQQLLQQIAECHARDAWPGYDSPDAWRIPNLQAKPVALSIGGQTVEV